MKTAESKKHNRVLRLALLAALSVAVVACASVVRRDPPSIAHIHIGHAITGWPLTPNKQGLLVVAELTSLSAATNSERLLDATREGNLAQARLVLREISESVDPTLLDPEDETGYGLRRAAAEAITHLRLASEVDDASANVQRSVTRSEVKSRQIIDRTDELTAYLAAGLQTESVAELEIIAEEVLRSLRVIAGGPEVNDNYGLYDFREDIDAMVAREDPPYQTVDSWFLFNLVKLPDGHWGFASRRSRGAAGLGY